MHKSLFGLAALVFAAGFFLRSLPSTQAQDFGPVVTGGEAPWVDFTGSLDALATVDLYTVPSDRALVLTAVSMSNESLDLWETGPAGAALRVEGHTNVMNSYSGRGGALARGTGHTTFGPGTTVHGRSTDNNYSRFYYVQGYPAAP